MKWLQALWRDESGAVLSSELVLVGTVGVIGATVGLSAVKNSINQELVDVAKAIRSLDQSYCFEGTEGCGAWTAGSSFKQEPVEKSLQKMDRQIAAELKAAKEESKQKKAKPKRPQIKKPLLKRPESQNKKKRPKQRPKRGKKPKDAEVIL